MLTKLETLSHFNLHTEKITLQKTALLHVKTDLLNALDNKDITCLVLLDLSAAFDTIKIDYLLNRLHYHFGTTGMTLKWFEEYLTDCKQEVIIPVRTKHNNSQLPLNEQNIKIRSSTKGRS